MIHLFEPNLPISVYDNVDEVLMSGTFIKGPKVKEFEEKWANRCGMEYCVAVDSGAMALEIVCQILKPKSTFPWTYKAVWNAMDRILGSHLFTSRPDIYAHHLHDQPPSYEPMIEDCSHAHGYKPVAETAIFSMYPTKILGACGDAGVIVTNSKYVEEKARKLIDHGEYGTNGRMDEIQAAVLLARLPHLDSYIKERQRIVNIYDLAFERKTEGKFHYVYAIEGSLEKARKLGQMGIETKFYYSEQYMALPMYPGLKDEEIKEVIKCIQRL